MNDLNPINIVVSVVDSEHEQNFEIGEVVKDKNKLKRVIRIAEKNGLYYDFIYKLKELDIDLSLLDENRWKKENEKLSEFKKTISFLNNISKEYGIDYILIKACNTVPHIPNDIDIFVRKEERQKLIKALENNGMKCLHSSVAETKLKGNYMKIDIYTEICYVGVSFIDTSFLWESRVKMEFFGVEYPSLNGEADFLLLLVHSVFGHRTISLLDFLHAKHLRDNININTCEKYAYEQGWGGVFDLIVKRLDTLYEIIYKKEELIRFPYLFDRDFILKCISEMDQVDVKKHNKMFRNLALIQDRIIYESKDTPIYNLLKSFEPVRNRINSLTAYVKSLQGDQKSMDYKRD